MIEIKSLVELMLVVLGVKLVVLQWQPPFQKSVAGLICVGIGILFGVIMNPSKEGLTTAIIGSFFAFYGGELLQAFKDTTKDIRELEELRRGK